MPLNSLKTNSLAKSRRVQSIADAFSRVVFSILNKVKIERFDTLQIAGKTKFRQNQFWNRVINAYSRLDNVHKTFICNIYFFDNRYGTWSYPYPTSTFYKIRAKAIELFLRYFDEEK